MVLLVWDSCLELSRLTKTRLGQAAITFQENELERVSNRTERAWTGFQGVGVTLLPGVTTNDGQDEIAIYK